MSIHSANDELLGVFRLPVNMTGDIQEYLVVRRFYCRRLNVDYRKMSLCMRISAQQGLGPNQLPFMPLCNYDELFKSNRRHIVAESIKTFERE